MSGFTILELADPRWAEFVARQPSATPFHHPNWAGLIAECYGFRAFAVATRDAAGDIRAGLPVVEVRHLRGEPKWVSLPFTDYCPPLVPAPQQEIDLLGALQRASRAAGIRRVEVRAPLHGACCVSRGALRHAIALDGGPAAVSSHFRRSVRKNILRAGRRGVTIRRAERPEDLVDTFYGLHLRTRRRFGVPVQPRRFFRMLWDSMICAGLGSVFIAEASARPVAAEVLLSWNGTAISKYSASDERAWPLRANSLITWHLIKTACEQGSRCLDFGRTDAGNEGLRAFKQSWGAAEEPLVYGTFEPQPATARDGIADHLLASVIRHSPPLICRAAGEALYRYAALGGTGMPITRRFAASRASDVPVRCSLGPDQRPRHWASPGICGLTADRSAGRVQVHGVHPITWPDYPGRYRRRRRALTRQPSSTGVFSP